MKALKEKRLSLRSFIRRGLVILSLFALAFASCDSSGGSTDTTSGGSEAPTYPPAIEIIIKAGPSEHWYQGAAPDPTGMIIDVKYAGSNDYVTVTAAEFKAKGFSIEPKYCDEPGAYPLAGDFYVGYAWGGQSQAIPYKGVVYLTSIGSVTLPLVKADVIYKSMVGQSLGLNYVYNTASPYSGTPVLEDEKTRVHSETITVNGAYPPQVYFDYSGMVPTNPNKYFKIPIGVKAAYAGGVSVSSGATTAGNSKNIVWATVNITKYLQIVDITLQSTDPDVFWAYDDEKEIDDAAPATGYVNSNLSAKLAGAKFTIWYQDAYTSKPESDTITWTEFVSRVVDAHLANEIDPVYTAAPIKKGSYGTRMAKEETGGYAPNDERILNYSDDDIAWWVILEYVPREYLDKVAGLVPGSTAYVGTVEVNIPIAEFQQDLVVDKRWDSHEIVLAEFGQNPPTPLTQMLIDNINHRWTLTGTYKMSDGTVKTKLIAFNSKILNFGYNSANIGVNLNPKGAISLADPMSYASGYFFYEENSRDWGLPVRYRATTVDADDSVLLNIYRVGTGP